MRRRRRVPVTWFPNLGTAGIATTDDWSGRAARIPALSNGTTSTQILPVTFDSPDETEQATTADPLVSLIGSEYLLRRIVGKILLCADTQDGSETRVWTGVLVTCGWFVARANDTTLTGGTDVPIGSTGASAVDAPLYGPQHPDVIREPWMWRRSWILGNPGSQVINGTRGGFSSFPSNNALYGSVSDGPHFDVKVKRRVSSDDRLWWIVQTRQLDDNGNVDPITTSFSTTNTTQVRWVLDYRILGSLRKARNRGNF